MGYKHTAPALQAPGLTPTERAVLALCAEFANTDNDDCMWHDQDDLADRLEVRRETVGRSLAKLEKLGYITRTRRYRSTPDGGRRDRDTIKVHHDLIAAKVAEKDAARQAHKEADARVSEEPHRDTPGPLCEESSHAYVTNPHVVRDKSSQHNREKNQEKNREHRYTATATPQRSATTSTAPENLPIYELPPHIKDTAQDMCGRPAGLPTEADLDALRAYFGPDLADWLDSPNDADGRTIGVHWTQAGRWHQDPRENNAARYVATTRLRQVLAVAAEAGVPILNAPSTRKHRPLHTIGREDAPGIEAEVEKLRESGELHPDVVAGIACLEATTQPPLDGLAAVAVPDRLNAGQETRRPTHERPEPSRTTGDTMDPSQNASEPYSAPHPDSDRLARIIRAGSITSSPEPEPPQWQPWTA